MQALLPHTDSVRLPAALETGHAVHIIIPVQLTACRALQVLLASLALPGTSLVRRSSADASARHRWRGARGLKTQLLVTSGLLLDSDQPSASSFR